MSQTEEDRLWAAVTEPGRRRLLDVLVAHGEATPTALARALPYSRQAVSKHLSVLLDAGVVKMRRAGREAHYTIDADRFAIATRAMSLTAAAWDARLRAIKRIAETAHREAEAAAAQPTPTGEVA